ncbi:IPTL-CTERM sorting domain-containing protein [Diaphorobacter aerolatus]
MTESVTPVPSLGEWALLWLTALLGAFGYLGMRKTRVR